MSNLGLYVICLGVPLVFGLWAQHKVKSTFARYAEVPEDTGLSGEDVARRILDANGLQGVPIRPVAGALTDHYDPRSRSVNLSEPVFAGTSISSTAVAAHEVGHAIQHARSYVPMTARSAIWPLASIGSQAWFFILLLGLFFNAFGLVQLALVVFALVVLFQVVTLPVEFNASRRAMANIRELGLVSGGEAVGARRTLTAAAMTYVAAALTSIAQLLYFLMAFGRN